MNIPFNPQDLFFGLAPLVIAALVRPDWGPWLKFLTALAVCVVAAVLQTYFGGQLDFHSLGGAATKIFLVVMTTYGVFWKKFQPASDLLDFVEQKINGGPPAPSPGSPPFPGLDAGGPGVGQ